MMETFHAYVFDKSDAGGSHLLDEAKKASFKQTDSVKETIMNIVEKHGNKSHALFIAHIEDQQWKEVVDALPPKMNAIRVVGGYPKIGLPQKGTKDGYGFVCWKNREQIQSDDFNVLKESFSDPANVEILRQGKVPAKLIKLFSFVYPEILHAVRIFLQCWMATKHESYDFVPFCTALGLNEKEDWDRFWKAIGQEIGNQVDPQTYMQKLDLEPLVDLLNKLEYNQDNQINLDLISSAFANLDNFLKELPA